MTFPIISYEVYWDTTNDRGGVDLVLAEGRLINLSTDRPDVLTLWSKLLDNPRAFYFHDTDSAGICTINHPRKKTVPPGSHTLYG